MIGIDKLQIVADRAIEIGAEKEQLFSAEEVISVFTRLRQAEKDAARYRELRDAESETCLEFINAKARAASPEWLDGLVDEYMKCSN